MEKILIIQEKKEKDLINVLYFFILLPEKFFLFKG